MTRAETGAIASVATENAATRTKRVETGAGTLAAVAGAGTDPLVTRPPPRATLGPDALFGPDVELLPPALKRIKAREETNSNPFPTNTQICYDIFKEIQKRVSLNGMPYSLDA